jgi:oligoendopeptidase F
VSAPQWELDSLCAPEAFGPRCAALRARMDALLASLPCLDEAIEAWAALLLELEDLFDELHELVSYATCLAATGRPAAAAAADELYRRHELLEAGLGAALDQLDDEAFEALRSQPGLEGLGPRLEHARQGRRLRLPPALQALKLQMDREGLVAWGRLYDQVASGLVAEVELEGRRERTSLARLGALRADERPEVRRAVSEAVSSAWGSARGICAHALTQLVGSRQQQAERLGVDELAQTLHENRAERALLEAMWSAAELARPILMRYLRHKARLLGVERLDWWDVGAPLGRQEAWTWPRACAELATALGSLDPELERFVQRAVSQRWIDALPREGRRPGAFCASFPRSGQSRVFLTFTGSIDQASALAHELGHALHNQVLQREPPSRRLLHRAVAETASLLTEALFRDRVLQGAADPAQRACLLDQQLQRAVTFLMDMPHRYAFERRLYELRAQGPLDPDQLAAESVALQRRWYGEALASYDPLSWCSRMHLFLPESSFYNWTYTFGYLLSGSIWARAPRWSELGELLRRTGWQDLASLGRDTLGVDLRREACWADALAPLQRWVEALESET